MLTQSRAISDLDFDDTRPLMRRISQSKNRGIDQILQKIRKNSHDDYLNKTKMLKIRRRKTQNQQRKAYYKDIYQQQMKPGDAVLRIFSQSKPLNTGDPYLDPKQKSKLIFSSRIYTRMPNIISGTYLKKRQTETQLQRQEWMNRKFSEYDRIVTEQTGPMRIFIKKRAIMEEGIEVKKPIYVGKLKNSKDLFQAYQSDRNNFYDNAKQTFSTNAFTFNSKTQTSIQDTMSSKINLKQKIKRIKSQTKDSVDQGWSRRIQTDF